MSGSGHFLGRRSPGKMEILHRRKLCALRPHLQRLIFFPEAGKPGALKRPPGFLFSGLSSESGLDILLASLDSSEAIPACVFFHTQIGPAFCPFSSAFSSTRFRL